MKGITTVKNKIVVRVSYDKEELLPVWVSYNTTPAYTSTLRMTMQDASDLRYLLNELLGES